jgi:hypothetical protein
VNSGVEGVVTLIKMRFFVVGRTPNVRNDAAIYDVTLCQRWEWCEEGKAYVIVRRK